MRLLVDTTPTAVAEERFRIFARLTKSSKSCLTDKRGFSDTYQGFQH
jgi:hypothetical protein